MSLTAKLDRLVPDLSATLLRFPVPAAIAFALCIYLNIQGLNDAEEGWEIIVAGACGFLASGTVHLFAEGRRLGRGANPVLALGAGLIFATAGYFTYALSTNPLFLCGGLVAAVMIAAYLRRGTSQESLWLFNLRFGLAALLATVVGLVFALGLSGIVEALNSLFNAGLNNTHEHIWVTALTLIGPVYGLSLMPRDLGEEIDIASHRGTLLERGVSVLINYVAVPVVVIYALILHAYAVKILLDGALPKGQLGAMVSIFAVGGTATWLVAWPWSEAGTRLLRLFMGWWFFLLIVPAILLAIAIARRLSDYGMTPERYGILLVAVWVALLTLYLAIRRNHADMRAILGAAGVLLLIGSVGPWGANGLTITSQMQRLEDLLVRNDVLKDGKVTASPVRYLVEDGSEGYSIVYVLRDVGGLDRLRPWFVGHKNDPFAGEKDTWSWSLAQRISEQMGFIAFTPVEIAVSLTSNVPVTVAVGTGGEVIGPFFTARNAGMSEPPKPMTVSYDQVELRIVLADSELKVPVKTVLETAKAATITSGNEQKPATLEIAPGVTMVIDQAYGTLGEIPDLSSARFWIIRRRQP